MKLKPNQNQNHSKITTAIELITPETAIDLLLNNDHNRAIGRGTVERYARAMKDGLWKLNGETIKIAEDGSLLDGQHRLEAVKLSGVSCEMLLVRGLPAEVFTTMDTGRARTASDVLSIQGELNTVVTAGACRILYCWDNDIPFTHLRSGRGTPNITSDNVLQILRKHPDIRTFVSQAYLLKILPPSPAAFMWYITSRSAPVDADIFFDRLATGSNLEKGDPILKIREFLFESKKRYGKRLNSAQVIACLFKTWNAWVEGKGDRNLIWRQHDPNEPYPVLSTKVRGLHKEEK